MKKLLLIGIGACLFNNYMTYAVQIIGETLEVQEPSPGFFQYTTIGWLNDSGAYTNGGTTFTFPTNWFRTGVTPYVVVSVQPATYAAGEAFIAEITSVSNTAVTIRVNKISTSGGGTTFTSVAEAATNDVTLAIYVQSYKPE